MGFRFFKSFKINKYLKLNVSSSGISFTGGVKGAKLNVGSKGTFLNLSIPKTGVSYRQKISSLGLGTIANIFSKKENDNNEAIESYEDSQDYILNLHKYTDNVLDEKTFIQHHKDTNQQLLDKLINGDKETIENKINEFMESLTLTYPFSGNYQLEENILYCDIDLPEIENLLDSYLVKQGNKTVQKKKSQTTLKQEYVQLIETMAIFLTANYFNISPFIKTIIMSGFTTRRNKSGDLKDEYIYSIKFTRDVFENTNLTDLNNLYSFLLQFENRINLVSGTTFKTINPYQNKQEDDDQQKQMIMDALEGLKSLGYKANEIKKIVPDLEKGTYDSVNECLRQALKLLAK